MLAVRRVTLRDIRLQLKEPFRISSGVTSDRHILLVELHDADGTTAWGECVADDAPNYSPETIETCRLAIRSWLAPAVMHRRFGSAAEVRAALEPGVRGHRMAKAAIEMAMWALDAEQRGVPLAELLGGTRREIPVGISLGIQSSAEALAAKALAARDQGYQRIKLKIMPGADVSYVAAVRRAVGPDLALSVDANAAYAPADADHLARLDAYALAMIEQPLDPDDLRRHADLQRRLQTPICLDESITSPARAEDAVALGSARIVNIKPGRVGGFQAAREIHDICAAHGIPVWCGGMLESGIGRAHNVALASLSNFSLPGDLSPSARYWARDIVTPEWTMRPDGTVVVPRDRPGLGVTVERHRLDRLTTRVEDLSG
jgi:O-succinylbenzoate synthase